MPPAGPPQDKGVIKEWVGTVQTVSVEASGKPELVGKQMLEEAEARVAARRTYLGLPPAEEGRQVRAAGSGVDFSGRPRRESRGVRRQLPRGRGSWMACRPRRSRSWATSSRHARSPRRPARVRAASLGAAAVSRNGLLQKRERWRSPRVAAQHGWAI